MGYPENGGAAKPLYGLTVQVLICAALHCLAGISSLVREITVFWRAAAAAAAAAAGRREGEQEDISSRRTTHSTDDRREKNE